MFTKDKWFSSYKCAAQAISKKHDEFGRVQGKRERNAGGPGGTEEGKEVKCDGRADHHGLARPEGTLCPGLLTGSGGYNTISPSLTTLRISVGLQRKHYSGEAG